MKRILLCFTTIISFVLISCSTSANSSNQSGGSNSDKVSIESFDVKKDGFERKVDNSVEKYSFIGQVSVPTNFTWNLFYDSECKNEIVTKTIQCELGNNRIYMLVRNSEDTIGYYTVDLYRYHLYSVTFDTKGGTLIPPQNIQENSLIKEVEQPIKKGYTFKKWDYDFAKPVISNLKVTAIYEANKYLITYDTNGGKNLDTDTQEVYYDSQFMLKETERLGYDFLGWYDKQNKIENGKWSYAEDKTLTAEWSIVDYTISYHLDGGVNSANNPYSYTVMDNVVLDDASKTGYSFDGWFLEESLITPILSISEGTTGNKDLYAKWDANTYKVVFDVNGGDDLDDNTKYYKFESNVALPETKKIGYEFEGWYYNDTLIEDGPWNIAEDITLVARWIPNSYKATFNSYSTIFVDDDDYSYTINYHYSQSRIEKEHYSVGQPIDVLIPTELYNNKLFVGWFLDESFSIPFDISSPVTEKEIDVYAKWSDDTDVLNKCSQSNGDVYTVTLTNNPSSTSAFGRRFAIPATGKYLLNITPHLTTKGSSASGAYFFISNVTKNGAVIKNYHFYNQEEADKVRELELNLTAGTIVLVKVSNFGSDLITGGSFNVSIEPMNQITANFNKEYFNKDFLYGSKYSLGTPIDDIDGKSFVGWYTKPNGDGVKISDENGNSLVDWLFLEDIEVYPFFE